MHKEAGVMKSTLDFIVSQRPYSIVLENVKGILVRSGEESLAPSEHIVGRLVEAGYHIGVHEIDLSAYHRVVRQRRALVVSCTVRQPVATSN